MKHLDVRALWLQDLKLHGRLTAKKIDRTVNWSDMLTDSPTAKEWGAFGDRHEELDRGRARTGDRQ